MKQTIVLDASKPAVKIKRNALCPCKSGKKWKRCCGLKLSLAKAKVLSDARARRESHDN